MRIGSYKTDGESEPYDFILLNDDGEFVDIEVHQELLRQIWELQVRIDAMPACQGKHSNREKIEEWFARHEFGDDLASLPKEHLEICGEYAGQIIALFDEEGK